MSAGQVSAVKQDGESSTGLYCPTGHRVHVLLLAVLVHRYALGHTQAVRAVLDTWLATAHGVHVVAVAGVLLELAAAL